MSNFKTEEHKNRKFMFLCLKQQRICLYVLMSKQKSATTLRSGAQYF